ncbi:MAG: hypothetical protein ACFB10_04060 [Salibacteraceae bacterium]
MKYLILGGLLVLLAAHPATPDHQSDYLNLCQTIEKNRIALAEKYVQAENEVDKNRVLDTAEAYLLTVFQQKMLPAWMGTPWDFNGISAIPGKGEIACGYFVSTTLKHAGFELNRFRLAQQYSHSIVKSLSLGQEVVVLRNAPLEKAVAYFESRSENLYVVGLDNHVGFVERLQGKLFFTHSNYIDREGVVREPLTQSNAFASSQTFVIGAVMPQRELLKRWLMKESIPIVT